jgi:uncharacterized membrane protein
MLELILWLLVGLIVTVVVLLSLVVVVGYVTQVAYLEDSDDWNEHD